MSGMDMPEWAGELKPEMVSRMKNMGGHPTAKEIDLHRVTNYSTFFGEWEIKDKDIVVHLFPRSGPEDTWELGRYIPRCKNCDRERSIESIQKKEPCSCGNIGLVYIPGRQEVKGGSSFPEGVEGTIKAAVDKVWAGSVAIERVEELGAYVVQLQNAWNNRYDQLAVFLESLFDNLDECLEDRKHL